MSLPEDPPELLPNETRSLLVRRPQQDESRVRRAVLVHAQEVRAVRRCARDQRANQDDHRVAGTYHVCLQGHVKQPPEIRKSRE